MKEFFPWLNEYNIGIQKIDEQHKFIIEVINELYDAFINKQHKEKMEDIIKKLEDYTDFHFKTEEEYFQRFGYTEKEKHIEEHDYFRDKIAEFKNEFKNTESALTFSVLNFLRNWWINHIQGTDRNYVNFLKENGL